MQQTYLHFFTLALSSQNHEKCGRVEFQDTKILVAKVYPLS